MKTNKNFNNYECDFLGNNYGGFPCIPSLVNENSNVLSFGVGEDISFDQRLMGLTNCKIELFDFTPKSISKFKHTKNTIFNEYGISDYDGMLDVYHEGPNVFSKWPAWLGFGKTESLPVKSLSTIMKEKNIDKIDLLKMDIKGEEYRVIPNMIKSNIFPTQICIGFHPYFLDHSTWRLQNYPHILMSQAKENNIKSHEEVFDLVLDYYDLAGRSYLNNESDHEYCFILK